MDSIAKSSILYFLFWYLTIDESTLIGNYDAQNVYSVETIGDRVYIGTYDGYVKVLTENNIEIADYKVGDFPGDFEMWRK